MYIIGLQETCQLGFFRVLKGHDPEVTSHLKKIFSNAINIIGAENNMGEYKCFAERPMVGCLILGFIKKELMYKIKKV